MDPHTEVHQREVPVHHRQQAQLGAVHSHFGNEMAQSGVWGMITLMDTIQTGFFLPSLPRLFLSNENINTHTHTLPPPPQQDDHRHWHPHHPSQTPSRVSVGCGAECSQHRLLRHSLEHLVAGAPRGGPAALPRGARPRPVVDLARTILALIAGHTKSSGATIQSTRSTATMIDITM